MNSVSWRLDINVCQPCDHEPAVFSMHRHWHWHTHSKHVYDNKSVSPSKFHPGAADSITMCEQGREDEDGCRGLLYMDDSDLIVKFYVPTPNGGLLCLPIAGDITIGNWLHQTTVYSGVYRVLCIQRVGTIIDLPLSFELNIIVILFLVVGHTAPKSWMILINFNEFSVVRLTIDYPVCLFSSILDLPHVMRT